MPQPFVHMHFAAGVIDRWRTALDAPVDVGRADVVNAFMHGSLGPDMGFFPGADAAISRLTHRVFTSRLVRELYESSRSEVERAFALGWVTHVLADAEIHPLVNRAAARLNPHADDTGAEWAGGPAEENVNLLAHVRVEIGIDLWYFDRAGTSRTRRLRHAFDAKRIDFLADALRRTYSLPFSPRQLLATHRNVTRLYNAYLLLAMVMAPDIGARAHNGAINAGPRRGLVRWIQKLMRAAATPVSAGFVHPVKPAGALIERVNAALATCSRSMDRHVASGLRDLPDLDLETGAVLPAVSVEPRDDRLRVRRRRALAAQVGRDGVAVA